MKRYSEIFSLQREISGVYDLLVMNRNKLINQDAFLSIDETQFCNLCEKELDYYYETVQCRDIIAKQVALEPFV